MTLAQERPPGRVAVSRGRLPAALVLLGAMLSFSGLSWDVQWHIDVGPDTFFTLPHLVLYAGSALAGLASLAVVLATTAARRADRPVDEAVGGRAVPVFGRLFSAPVGYLVSGTGAASFLLYGLVDLWWHELYGFDAVIASPPHIGLILSVALTMVGALMVFAAASAHRWGRSGVLGAFTVLLGFTMVATNNLAEFAVGPIDPAVLGTTFLVVAVAFTAVGFLDNLRLALLFAVVFAATQAVLWWFSPWAAHAYAAQVGLPLRDYIDGPPYLPANMPMILIAVVALVHVATGRARRAGNRPRWVAAVVGGSAGALTAVAAMVQVPLVYGNPIPPIGTFVAPAVLGLVAGTAAGLVGPRFGRMLRALAPAAPSGAGR
ncbi:hypothetical protein [Rhizohabitans arisaemae]|uniref:hypothetical protein n=1 Tax=Rhizohabitans arisaemae TaxID=2720610 RepID=UPI0024B08E2C|nr:hypothetical protein [Rhizohabitans arisaemae]